MNDLTDNKILELKDQIDNLLDTIYKEWDNGTTLDLYELVDKLDNARIRLTEQQIVREESLDNNNENNWII